MATKTEILVNELKINYLSKKQYEESLLNGDLNENELYMTDSKNTIESNEVVMSDGYNLQETIDNLLDLHVWNMYTAEPFVYKEEEVTNYKYYSGMYLTASYSNVIKIADTISLYNPKQKDVLSSADILKGNYVATSSGEIIYIPLDATLTNTLESSSGSYNFYGYYTDKATKFTIKSFQKLGYVKSNSENAYPSNGEKDGIWYVYNNKLGESSDLSKFLVTPTVNNYVSSGSDESFDLEKEDSTSASAIGTGSLLVTERDIYYGLPKINNSHTYNSNTNIYAPTSGGTSNYILKSNGSTSTPTWINQTDLKVGSATSADSANTATTATSASKLSTARTIRTNLASTSTASFDGSANITPGVTGTLPIANGGTGATTAANALKNLGLTATATELNYCDGVTSNIQDQFNKIGARAIAVQSSSQSISSGSLTKINISKFEINELGATISSGNIINVPEGLYDVKLVITYTNPNTTGDRYMSVNEKRYEYQPKVTGYQTITYNTICRGSSVTGYFYQNSGSSVSLSAVTNYYGTYIEITRLQ